MPVEYVSVTDDEWADDYIQLPTEDDGTLMLTTVANNFPGCCGLTYKHPETETVRGLRLKDERLYPPSEGWETYKYHCSFPKENSILKMMQKEATDLIVLGLPWRATEQTVREYFEKFGKVRKVWLKKNSKGQSKGFAFVRFATYYTQMRVLTKKHTIDGRRCDVLIPHSKKGLVFKVFVGGCTEDISTTDLKDYFSKFGEVTDVFIPKPFRAFGFVTFLDPEVAQSVCEENHIIKGVSVNVSIASPKQNQPRSNGNNNTNNHNADNVHMYQNGMPHNPKEESFRERQYVNDYNNWNNHNFNVDMLNFQGLDINGQSMQSNVNMTQSQNANVPPNPFSLPVNRVAVASALGQTNWGLFNHVPTAQDQGSYGMAGGSQHVGVGLPGQDSGNFLTWLQRGGNFQSSPSANWGQQQFQVHHPPQGHST